MLKKNASIFIYAWPMKILKKQMSVWDKLIFYVNIYDFTGARFTMIKVKLMDKYKIGNVTDNEKYAASNKVY